MKPGNVAVVDDDPLTRSALECLLSELGYPCRSYADGGDLLSTIESSPPAITILDLNMPGVSGAEVLEAYAEKGIESPVIVVTAANHAQTTNLRDVFALLHKPIEPSALIALLVAAIGQPDRGLPADWFSADLILGEARLERPLQWVSVSGRG